MPINKINKVKVEQAPPPAPSKTVIKCDIPEKLGFLFEKHRYKISHGGRGGGKSHSFAKALLALGATKPLRILCAREVQNSLKDSVHALLTDQIKSMGLGSFYEATEKEIRGRNGTQFIFSGLANHTVESIKSYEGINICWVEEAHVVTRRSWDILIPTIRVDESEIWISLNPDMEDDETYQRMVVHPPDDSVVVSMNWRDNPWFPGVLQKERMEFERKRSKEDYDNIWEGKPRTTILGAIYALEIAAATEDRRFRRTPYDPRFPVHTAWDLGWNDKMVVIMVQKVAPSVINIINYYEDNFKRYDQIVGHLESLGYRWGTDYMPHDAANKNPQTGRSAEMTLRDLGRKQVKIYPKGDPDEEIRQARMFFPRIFIDDSVKEGRDGGFHGGGRLIECLRKYRRAIPKSSMEPAAPVHNEFSHGADAFRLLAKIADKIMNPADLRSLSAPTQLPFMPSDPGMGVLG